MKFEQIAQVCGGKLINGSGAENIEAVKFVTDSREAKEGCIFVCIKGERVDGHDYISSAEANGACGFLCEKELDTQLPYVIVPSSVKALGDFASNYRSGLNMKTVAVTGSVGKTTTKEFIYCVLAQGFKAFKTEGNKNSDIGLPLTLLSIPKDCEASVLEMGMSNFGEIDVLTKIARPDVAVITNIGFSHIEYLKTQENIMKAKLEILNGLSPDGTLILNGDDALLKTQGKAWQKTLFYGIGNEDCQYRARDILFDNGSTTFLAVTPEGNVTVKIPTEGLHNVYNALAAIAVGHVMGISPKEAAAGFANYKNAPLRQNVYEKEGFTIIEDCYNASPASMQSALELLRFKNGRKIAVLGDMLELGALAPKLHKQVGTYLHGIDMLVAFGNHNDDYACGALEANMKEENIFKCNNTEEVAAVLEKIAEKGDVILFKASRGMKAENALALFFEKMGK
ncbi:MAG: UDP-N-acetylmuramoyl-tripeptide--D-alanyl-D-alanine ligase [Clostridia bacterium]|nr:UDP-N-acetylmuramoyl-tripeptide--D-alanyl-D-alanine ligase [Clostridia bacterium]